MSQLTPNALNVLSSRYLLRSENGAVAESPDELFIRVSKAIAEAELSFRGEQQYLQWFEAFYRMLSNLDFLPNSPTLMNAGTHLNQLAACFVLPVRDSIDSIFTTLHDAALIQQSGGGTGFNFTNVRPNGDFVHATGGDASGPVSFMKVYDVATANIKQGGKRRGANMGILNIDHPDIEEFIQAKSDHEVLTNFNISVGVSDAFMECLETGDNWSLRHPLTGLEVKKINSCYLWEMIIHSAWLTGDPGIIFLDEINRKQPTPGLGKINCTNPCGEVPLLPYESCNLGSINLVNMLRRVNNKWEVDWKKLDETITTAVRFLDNVIECNTYILPETESMVKGNRKIGLGVMGWADILIRLEIPYASSEAINFGEKLMRFINEKSFEASVYLARERGEFPNFSESVYRNGDPVRNATRTSIAPTGTISIIAGVSSSIEPLFALAYQRKGVLQNETMQEVNQLFLEILKENKLDTKEITGLLYQTGSAQSIKELPAGIKNLFRTSLEIGYGDHLLHQIAFQKHTDNAVSKTINLPEETTEQEIDQIYRNAWHLRAKGITIFRTGSKPTQVLNVGAEEDYPHALECRVCIT